VDEISHSPYNYNTCERACLRESKIMGELFTIKIFLNLIKAGDIFGIIKLMGLIEFI